MGKNSRIHKYVAAAKSEHKQISLSAHTIPMRYDMPVNGATLVGDVWHWGRHNDYPGELRKLAKSNPIHGIILQNKLSYVFGKGINKTGLDQDVIDFLEDFNRMGHSLEDVIYMCANDMIEIGAATVNPVWSENHKEIAEINYAEPANYRYTKDFNFFSFKNDWKTAIGSEIYYPVFDPNFPSSKEFDNMLENETDVRKREFINKRNNCSQILWAKSLEAKELYGEASYEHTLKDVKSGVNITDYHYGKSEHPMMGDLLVEMYDPAAMEMTDEERADHEKAFKKKFTGTNVAGNQIIFSYAQNREQAIRIDPIAKADSAGQDFLSLRDETKYSIISGHGVPSASVLAMPSKGLVFDSGYEAAYNIFDKVVIKKIQRNVLRPFNMLLSKKFGKKISLEFLPLGIIDAKFTDQRLVTEYMTEPEVREHLQKAGFIKDAAYEPGTLNKDKIMGKGGVTMSEDVDPEDSTVEANPILANMTGRQYIHFKRIKRQYLKKDIDLADAKLLLSGFGLSDDQINNLLGVIPEITTEE